LLLLLDLNKEDTVYYLDFIFKLVDELFNIFFNEIDEADDDIVLLLIVLN
jgi:hypothetical protein